MAGGAERNGGSGYFNPSNLAEYKTAQEQVPRLEFNAEEEEFGHAIHDLFLKMYKQAEKSRRWTLHDIDWDKVSKQPIPRNLAITINTFGKVENFIQDYAESGLKMYRRNLGLSEGQINWAGEEQRHGIFLGETEIRSGAQTEEEVALTRMRMFGKIWVPAYNTPRRVVTYAMHQEWQTHNYYKDLADKLEEAEATEAARGVRFIMRDEAAHHDYYKKIVRMYGDRDPQGTAEDLLYVNDTFVMPAQLLLADSAMEYGRMMVAMKETGIFSLEKQQKGLDDVNKSLGFKSREDLVSAAA